MKIYSLILDRSGSMESIWNQITAAVNENLEKRSSNALSSLLLFDTEGLDYLFKYSGSPTKLDKENFKPRGGTPLRDAIMYGIETLIKDGGDFLNAENVEVEFTIFTDGQENASHFWNDSDVARAINHFQTEYGWKFNFIGAGTNTDVKNYAKKFGFKPENVIGYTNSEQLKEAFKAA